MMSGPAFNTRSCKFVGVSEDSGVYKRTRSNNPNLTAALTKNIPIQTKKPWVSATNTRPYMMDNALISYFKWRDRNYSMSASSNSSNSATSSKIDKDDMSFMRFIMNSGCIFEEKVIQCIYDRIPKRRIKYIANRFSPEGVEETRTSMKEGFWFVLSANVKDTTSRLYGIPDILARSDKLHLLCDDFPRIKNYDHGCKFSKNYHYVIVDIKFTTMNICTDGVHLLNMGSTKAFKGQLWVYNKCIAKMQGYKPSHGYILGRRFRCKSDGTSIDSCLFRLGVVSFFGYDKKLSEKARQAVIWQRNLKKNGSEMTLYPNPSHPELYPNMSKDSGSWFVEKVQLAENIKDITLLWMCGLKQQKICHDMGIYTWDDPRLTAEKMGFSGSRANIINNMIKINKSNYDCVIPNTFKEVSYTWKKPLKNDFFVDFETLNDVFTDFSDMPSLKSHAAIIFQIGVGYIDNGVWKYKSFLCKNLSLYEEKRILNEFVQFVGANSSVYFWHAEDKFWNTVRKNHNIDMKPNVVWKDLRKLFTENEAAVHGAFNYGLKSIAKALVKNGVISSQLISNCQNGQTAMVQAWVSYNEKSSKEREELLEDICKYNEYDCKVLWEILTYLREYHI